MKKCNRCGEYYFHYRDCACRKFTVIDGNGIDHTVCAVHEYLAALKFAKDMNECNDYYLMNDSEEITVGGKKYRISAAPDVQYYALEIEQQESQE